MAVRSAGLTLSVAMTTGGIRVPARIPGQDPAVAIPNTVRLQYEFLWIFQTDPHT